MFAAFDFVEMLPAHIDDVVSLVGKAMNNDEAQWARQTFEFHFACTGNHIESGRKFYVLHVAEQLTGIVGLHEYRWGPPVNCWLSWFAVHPEQQRKGFGKMLLSRAEQAAVDAGYTRMFIETYAHPDFQKAIAFYQSQGFEHCGEIREYLEDGSRMLILSRRLA